MANSSITLTSLDFDTNKAALKEYLKSQDRFKDYNFEGANLNVLLDVLSYNTFNNSFYLSMVSNEMFLDSAELRDSVVSHAKELNYTPRSFKSAEATIKLTVNTGDTTKRSLVIPKGFTFSSKMLNKTYTFSTNSNIVLTDFVVNDSTLTFTSDAITISEGYYVTDNFTYSGTGQQRFVISNKNIDTSSLSVTVVEDSGATLRYYKRAPSLFDIDGTSEVFFIQGSGSDSYEIKFGDGVSGRQPNVRSAIVAEYRISNGQLPNGCNLFTPDSTIEGSSDITVDVLTIAAGGDVSETLDSIKFNAPRHFAAQERAIVPDDYESLLQINFPEINAVSSYGGETLNPPQYGKVFIAVDLKEIDGLPDSKKLQYYNFIKPRSPMTPVLVNPEYTYLGVKTKVKYNINVTSLSADDIKTIVLSSILKYAQDNLNNFNKTFRYSPFVKAIDQSQTSIISNETNITVIKKLQPTLGVVSSFDVAFRLPLSVKYSTEGSYAVQSSPIIYGGVRSFIRDNGSGRLNIVSASGNAELADVGSVDYDTGLLQLSSVIISAYDGTTLKFTATPRDQDLSTINNVIINIVEDDVSIVPESGRE